MNRYADVDPYTIKAFLEMLRVLSDVMDAVSKRFSRYGLSTGRFGVLMLLNIDPNRSFHPSELADIAGVTRATITGLMDGLERDGLIARESDPNDRRATKIRLTRKAKKLLNEMLPTHFKRIADLMGILNERERKKLVELMGKLKKGIPPFAES